MKSQVFTICILVLVLGLSAAGIASASAAGAEEIIVNGVRISKSRIDQRTRLLKLTDRKRRTQARDRARKELIDEVLFSEIIRQANVRVSQEDVDRAYESIAERVGLSSRDLSGALRQSGIRPETLRNRLRAQIGMRQVKAALRKLEEAANERDIPAAIEDLSTKPHTISNRAFRTQRAGAFHAACYDTECNSPAQMEMLISDFPVPTEMFRQRQALLKLTGGLTATAAREAASRELREEIWRAQVLRRLKVRVYANEVATAFARVAERVGLTDQDLSAALLQNDISPQTLKSRLRV